MKPLPRYTATFIQSSDIFKMICEKYKLDFGKFSGDFSNHCTSVSYGDASNTLICPDQFIEILEGMENFSEAALEEIATWFSEDEKVDLES